MSEKCIYMYIYVLKYVFSLFVQDQLDSSIHRCVSIH